MIGVGAITMAAPCSICLEVLSVSQDVSVSTRNYIVSTKCKHLFHKTCIRKWWRRSQTNGSHKCPVCQCDLSRDELVVVSDLGKGFFGNGGTDPGPSAAELFHKLNFNIKKGERLLDKADELLVQMLDLLIDNNKGQTGSAESDVINISETVGGLKINDRVVWVGGEHKDDECDFGHVRWLGTVNDYVVAGVEFDGPIGNTNGELNGRQYFSCPPNRGRFVFVRELLLYNDYVSGL